MLHDQYRPPRPDGTTWRRSRVGILTVTTSAGARDGADREAEKLRQTRLCASQAIAVWYVTREKVAPTSPTAISVKILCREVGRAAPNELTAVTVV